MRPPRPRLCAQPRTDGTSHRALLSALAGLLVLLGVACTSDPAIPEWARATAVPATTADEATAVPEAPSVVTGTEVVGTEAAGTEAGGTGPGGSPGDEIDLGEDLHVMTFPPGDVVEFTTAPGDRAWSIAVTATDPTDLVGIRRVVDPTGQTRYLADLRNELLIVDELHPLVLADVDAVGLYVTPPTGEALPEGRWTVDVAANGTPPNATVVIRRGDPAAPQELDVVVWVTAPDVGDPSAVADAWRAQMDQALAPHGIAIGQLDVVPAGGAGRPFTVLGIDGLAEEVHEACTAASAATGAPPRAALVVLAGELREGVVTASAEPDLRAGAGVAYRQPDGSIDGYTVATPGTPVAGPASHACVVVRAGEDAAQRGLIALHEILHQAGLTRHTTERAGRDFDLLGDTPECPVEAYDVDRDRQVSRVECADVDGDNLLFWAVGGSTLTADQAWRVRAHPLLRPAD